MKLATDGRASGELETLGVGVRPQVQKDEVEQI